MLQLEGGILEAVASSRVCRLQASAGGVTRAFLVHRFTLGARDDDNDRLSDHRTCLSVITLRLR